MLETKATKANNKSLETQWQVNSHSLIKAGTVKQSTYK